MELEKVFKLIEAGFTKEEIIRLTGEPEQTEQPAQEEKPVEEAVPEEAQPEKPDMMADLLQEIKGMRGDLQKRSLLDDGFKPADSRQAAEAILAEIINPPIPERKGKKK